ncbi:MAG: mediator of RNA polymerase II transcription subunit 8 [Candelina submexicana]|nr:MAG: mediator of RNA polymerase II transcription subunit 8 [Candelina submexicana]
MTTLTQQDIKALEQTRQRLVQLTSNLASLQNSIHTSDPLPSWTSLQTTATILQQNLLSLSQHLTTHAPLFSSLSVYPLPSFPSRPQEALLGQLLRKKLEPHIEDYVELGRSTATPLSNTITTTTTTTTTTNNNNNNNPTISPTFAAPSGDGSAGALGLTDLEELWDWARLAANEEARKRMGLGAFTLEEREGGVENVVTGLRRKLEEDTSSGETSSGEDEEMEDGVKVETVNASAAKKEVPEVTRKSPEFKGPPLPLEDILRFMCTGAEPREPSGQAPVVGRR